MRRGTNDIYGQIYNWNLTIVCDKIYIVLFLFANNILRYLYNANNIFEKHKSQVRNRTMRIIINKQNAADEFASYSLRHFCSFRLCFNVLGKKYTNAHKTYTFL